MFARGFLVDNGFLAELGGSVSSIINAPEYGRVIHDLYLRRELIFLGQEMLDRAASGNLEDTADLQVSSAEEALTGMTTGAAKEIDSAAQMKQTLTGIETIFRGEQPPGVESGLTDLDRLLGRICNQDLVVIAGRPSMGKTILGINIAEKVAAEGIVQFFSLEMSAEQLNQRRIANKANVTITSMRTPKGLGQPEMDKIVPIGQELGEKAFLIEDTAAQTISQIRRKARRQKRKGLDLVVVDYLGLMRAEDPRMPKVYQIEAITAGLKALAKELDVPVILLCQLSRALEQRDNKRPMMSDLRDSGSIEQDADVVIFIYREEYYLTRDKPAQRDNETEDKFRTRCEGYKERLERSKNMAELIVAKQRQGPCGTVKAHFDGAMMRFGDAIKEDMF